MSSVLGPLLQPIQHFIHFGLQGRFDGVGGALAAGDAAYVGAMDAEFFGDPLLNATHKTKNALTIVNHERTVLGKMISFFRQ